MDELTKTALVGTSKLTGPPPRDENPAAALVSSLACVDREEALLLSAGARGVYRLAGACPRASLEAVPPAPADAKKFASRKIAGLLQNAIAAKSYDVLKEFLRLLHDAEILLPPVLLPSLLDSTDQEIRENLLPVIGERGEWLSRFNPDWSWVRMGVSHLTATDQQALKRDWNEGTISERCQVIRALRAVDPALAREWVADVFAREKPNHRASLVEALEVGMSSDDEPFLEGCLNDRSGLVGQTAARLLCRLAQSALASRMRARAAAMLTLERSNVIREQSKLVCSPPENIDRDWERDGIPKQAPTGRGQRAFWAETTLAAVPPSLWTQRYDLSPSILIEAALDDPFVDAILAGWTEAAARFATDDPPSAGWFLPLWEHWAGVAGRTEGAGRTHALQCLRILLPKMPTQDAEAGLIRLYETGDAAAMVEALSFLCMLPLPWSDGFSLRFLTIVRHVLQTQSANAAYQWANSLFVAARAIPVAVFHAAVAPWDVVAAQGTAGWHVEATKREIDKFIATIETRQMFITELRA
jgi:Family of unknown function (DUF5691)